MSVLNKIVSYFKGINHIHGRDVCLLTILRSRKHEEKIKMIRSIPDKSLQSAKKKELLPIYTPAGRLNPRSESGLIELSGLACFDFDNAKGHNKEHLLIELKKIPYIAYAGRSCSGEGIFGFIPLLYPEKYERHYDSFIKFFEQRLMPMGDTCHKSIAQARYVSYNDSHTEFYNHQAEPFPFYEEKKYYLVSSKKPSMLPNSPIDWDAAFDWVVEWKSKDSSFADGKRHEFLLRVVRYANLKGIPESHSLSGCIRYFVGERISDYEVKNMVQNIYRRHKESHNRHPYEQK